MKTQPIPKVTRKDVLRVIRRDFPDVPESDVLAILEQYRLDDWNREVDRVHLAVLKLSNGKLKALRDYTDLACDDYRDVLAPAEYPAHSKHGWSTHFKHGQRAKTYQDDWNQYQQWLTRK